MTNTELKEQHNYNCEIIYRAICELNLDTCVIWNQVQTAKSDDMKQYMSELHAKKKGGYDEKNKNS